MIHITGRIQHNVVLTTTPQDLRELADQMEAHLDGGGAEGDLIHRLVCSDDLAVTIRVNRNRALQQSAICERARVHRSHRRD